MVLSILRPSYWSKPTIAHLESFPRTIPGFDAANTLPKTLPTWRARHCERSVAKIGQSISATSFQVAQPCWLTHLTDSLSFQAPQGKVLLGELHQNCFSPVATLGIPKGTSWGSIGAGARPLGVSGLTSTEWSMWATPAASFLVVLLRDGDHGLFFPIFWPGFLRQ